MSLWHRYIFHDILHSKIVNSSPSIAHEHRLPQLNPVPLLPQAAAAAAPEMGPRGCTSPASGSLKDLHKDRKVQRNGHVPFYLSKAVWKDKATGILAKRNGKKSWSHWEHKEQVERIHNFLKAKGNPHDEWRLLTARSDSSAGQYARRLDALRHVNSLERTPEGRLKKPPTAEALEEGLDLRYQILVSKANRHAMTVDRFGSEESTSVSASSRKATSGGSDFEMSDLEDIYDAAPIDSDPMSDLEKLDSDYEVPDSWDDVYNTDEAMDTDDTESGKQSESDSQMELSVMDSSYSDDPFALDPDTDDSDEGDEIIAA